MSALGLSWWQRYHTRQRVKRAAMLAMRNRARVHYTQGAERWQGIRRRFRSHRGEYPKYADCSSLATWCLWDATRMYDLPDFVNGHNWQAGYTGTQARYGRPVKWNRKLVGDLVFYGGTASVPGHVAIYVGRGMVVSHGSEIGPLYVRWDYRPVNQVRRYVR